MSLSSMSSSSPSSATPTRSKSRVALFPRPYRHSKERLRCIKKSLSECHPVKPCQRSLLDRTKSEILRQKESLHNKADEVTALNVHAHAVDERTRTLTTELETEQEELKALDDEVECLDDTIRKKEHEIKGLTDALAEVEAQLSSTRATSEKTCVELKKRREHAAVVEERYRLLKLTVQGKQEENARANTKLSNMNKEIETLPTPPPSRPPTPVRKVHTSSDRAELHGPQERKEPSTSRQPPVSTGGGEQDSPAPHEVGGGVPVKSRALDDVRDEVETHFSRQQPWGTSGESRATAGRQPLSEPSSPLTLDSGRSSPPPSSSSSSPSLSPTPTPNRNEGEGGDKDHICPLSDFRRLSVTDGDGEEEEEDDDRDGDSVGRHRRIMKVFNTVTQAALEEKRKQERETRDREESIFVTEPEREQNVTGRPDPTTSFFSDDGPDGDDGLLSRSAYQRRPSTGEANAKHEISPWDDNAAWDSRIVSRDVVTTVASADGGHDDDSLFLEDSEGEDNDGGEQMDDNGDDADVGDDEEEEDDFEYSEYVDSKEISKHMLSIQHPLMLAKAIRKCHSAGIDLASVFKVGDLKTLCSKTPVLYNGTKDIVVSTLVKWAEQASA